MVVERYFHVQRLSFILCGINPEAKSPEPLIKRPLICFIPLCFAIWHIAAMMHYAYVNRHDYVEVADCLTLFCQSSLAVWKMLIFFAKSKDFLEIINDVHTHNRRAGRRELPFIVSENLKDIKFCTVYFRSVQVSALFGLLSPVLESLFIYFTTGNLVLQVPYKASYFWSHSELPGYSLVYLMNVISIYNLFGISLAIDTLFIWLVSNISAQFHVLNFRFKEAAKTASREVEDRKIIFRCIKSCIIYHNQTLKMAEKLNQVYGEIIFFKFIITCSQICCLAFRLSRSNEKITAALYGSLFLGTVLMQLTLYCYNGQRIKDESLQVATEIYLSFIWSDMTIPHQKLLISSIIRAQRQSELRGVFFVVDLSLCLWVLKTAGSLITALKTLEDNQA